MRLRTWHLFAVCVLVWGTTWHAITWQVDATPPEVAVAIRFVLAGLAMLAIGALRGEPLALPRTAHLALAFQGVFLYGLSYVCVYQAERHVPSGLVAVGYSASPLLTGFAAQAVFGQRVGPRFVAGGVLGIVGVALIFWPEFGRVGSDPARSAALGAGATLAAVVLSALGALAASRNAQRGLPFWCAIGWGMLYGAGSSALVALLLGRHFALPDSTPWWIALGWLAFAGSALTFACLLALQQRVGPGRAATVGVMTPVLALVVSWLLEGWQPTALAGAGAALAVAANVLMLTLRRNPGA